MNIVKSIINDERTLCERLTTHNKGAAMRSAYISLLSVPVLRGLLPLCICSLAAAPFVLIRMAQLLSRLTASGEMWLLFIFFCLILTGVGAACIYLSVFLLHSIKAKETSAEQENYYQLLQKQAQLKVLQSQINPHFLYNTLDSVRGLALDEGAVRSAEMAEDLAVLFRYSIGNAADVVTIAEELQNVRTYIHIMDYRFNSRYHFSIENETPLDLNRCSIPKLVLQPIIENALFHGLYQKKKSGSVTIRITSTTSHIFIDVIDDGIGMDDRTLNQLNTSFKQPSMTEISLEDGRSHKSIALTNVNMRLRLLYGSEYMLTALSTPDKGTTISIVLPLLEVKNEGNSSDAKSVQTG